MAKNNAIKEFLHRIYQRMGTANLIMMGGVYLLVQALIVLAALSVGELRFNPGDIAPKTIVSDYDITYFDKSDLEKSIEFIQSSKPYYYHYMENHEAGFRERLSNVVNILRTPADADFLSLMNDEQILFSSTTLSYILQNRFLISQYFERFLTIYRIITSAYIIVDKLPNFNMMNYLVLLTGDSSKNINQDKIQPYPLDEDLLLYIVKQTFPRLNTDFQSSMAELLINIIYPTAYIDEQMRSQLIEQELKNSHSIRVIRRGEKLLVKGAIIDMNALSRIDAYNEYRQMHLFWQILINMILSTLLFFLLIYRYAAYEWECFRMRRNVALSLIFFLAANFLFYFAHLFKTEFLLPPFLMIFFGLLTITLPQLLLNNRVAIILLLSFTFFYVFYPSFSILTFLNLLTLTFSTIYTTKLMKSRKDFFIVGTILGVIEAVFTLLYTQTPEAEVWNIDFALSIVFAFGNGFTSAIVALGIMPLLENLLNIPTRFRLLELVNPATSPLLKRLKLEAAGTYIHSQTIGDMAEEASDKIGMDNSLLVKVGGYYHDIGKIENPDYFIENQMGRNIHDAIKPSISVSIIKSHVKIGIEIARQNGLPEEIVDYISQHHGTTTIAYFYHQALGIFGEENVNPEDYEYQGPIPQNKGTAIVQLADSVEAAVRAYFLNNERINTKIIQDIIDDIFANRMKQGQFNECDITLKEMQIVSHAFYKILSNVYHKRVDYKK